MEEQIYFSETRIWSGSLYIIIIMFAILGVVFGLYFCRFYLDDGISGSCESGILARQKLGICPSSSVRCFKFEDCLGHAPK